MDSPAFAPVSSVPTVGKEAIAKAIHNQEFLSLPASFPPESRTSSLVNDVHPIFQRSNWEDDSLYETLLPGLKLASLFITNRTVSRHWHTTCFGRRKVEVVEQPGAPPTTWQRGHVVLQSEPWTPEMQAEVEKLLQGLSGRLSFEFTPFEDKTAHAMHVPMWRKMKRFSRILIQDTFENCAQRILPKDNRDSDAALRFYFHIAVTLTHELAHALESSFKVSEQEGHRDGHKWHEAGLEWEISVCGGQPDTYDKLGDSKSRFCLFTLDSQGNYKDTMPIPMLWIWKIQQSATWQEPEAKLKEYLHLGTLKQELEM